jgi:hypothetical protein
MPSRQKDSTRGLALRPRPFERVPALHGGVKGMKGVEGWLGGSSGSCTPSCAEPHDLSVAASDCTYRDCFACSRGLQCAQKLNTRFGQSVQHRSGPPGFSVVSRCDSRRVVRTPGVTALQCCIVEPPVAADLLNILQVGTDCCRECCAVRRPAQLCGLAPYRPEQSERPGNSPGPSCRAMNAPSRCHGGMRIGGVGRQEIQCISSVREDFGR